jgi:hypothetical protein
MYNVSFQSYMPGFNTTCRPRSTAAWTSRTGCCGVNACTGPSAVPVIRMAIPPSSCPIDGDDDDDDDDP